MHSHYTWHAHKHTCLHACPYIHMRDTHSHAVCIHTCIRTYTCIHVHTHTHFFQPPALGPVALTRVPAVLKRRQLGTKPSPGAAGRGKDQRSPMGRSRLGQHSSRVWSRWRTCSTALPPARLGRWLRSWRLNSQAPRCPSRSSCMPSEPRRPLSSAGLTALRDGPPWWGRRSQGWS